MSLAYTNIPVRCLLVAVCLQAQMAIATTGSQLADKLVLKEQDNAVKPFDSSSGMAMLVEMCARAEKGDELWLRPRLLLPLPGHQLSNVDKGEPQLSGWVIEKAVDFKHTILCEKPPKPGSTMDSWSHVGMRVYGTLKLDGYPYQVVFDKSSTPPRLIELAMTLADVEPKGKTRKQNFIVSAFPKGTGDLRFARRLAELIERLLEANPSCIFHHASRNTNSFSATVVVDKPTAEPARVNIYASSVTPRWTLGCLRKQLRKRLAVIVKGQKDSSFSQIHLVVGIPMTANQVPDGAMLSKNPSNISVLRPVAKALTFEKPTICNTRKRNKSPKRLKDFDWCAFAALESEKWKQPKRRHRCKRADTRAEKKKCRPADKYELLGVAYADVVPAVAVLKGTNAHLCSGAEALLLFRVNPADNPLPRLVLQARCKSSFPPAPLRAGLNGEFELPTAIDQAIWRVKQGVVTATYRRGDEECEIVWIPKSDHTARYGIGLSKKNCRKID